VQLLSSSGAICFWRYSMPDHIHLLISEPEKGDPSRVMQAIKPRFSRRVLKFVRKRRVSARQELSTVRSEHVWQRRFYDFNIWTARKRIEKLSYMHRNPVPRGLLEEPEQRRGAAIGVVLSRK